MAVKWKRIIYSNGKARLVSECIILYLILPLLVMLNFLPVPLLLILLIMGIAVHLFLFHDPNFDRNNFINWKSGRKETWKIILLFIPLGALMVVLIWQIDKTKLFYLPTSNPWFLLLISIFYPVFSVVPQGLAYRALFFHRYGSLIPGKTLKIIISAIFFSFGHILYKNALVLLLAFFAGLIFIFWYWRNWKIKKKHFFKINKLDF